VEIDSIDNGSPQERNPVVEALQEELNTFRSSSFQLEGNEIENELRGLIRKSDRGKRQLFVFLGIPGSGKTKLIERIARLLKTSPFHVRNLVKVKPELRKLESEYYARGEIIPGIENDFLEAVFNSRSKNILVDGFPRTVFQALALYRAAVQNHCEVTIIETRLAEGKEVFQSFYRQQNRAAHRVKKGLLFGQAEENEQSRIIAKIRRSLDLDLYVIETLRLLDAEILTLDATRGPSKMTLEFKDYLGVSED